MDIVLQVIGLSFIPLLGVLILSGTGEIYHGLKEHFGYQDFKISELAFNQSADDFAENFGFRKFKTDFCKS